jgi:hypothetical protein
MNGTSAWPATSCTIPGTWLTKAWRDLGRASATELPVKFGEFQRMLNMHGMSWNSIADQFDRLGIQGHDLDPDIPLTLETLTALYRAHGGDGSFLPFAPWYSDCVQRMRRHEVPTAIDLQTRNDLLGRLRLSRQGVT